MNFDADKTIDDLKNHASSRINDLKGSGICKNNL